MHRQEIEFIGGEGGLHSLCEAVLADRWSLVRTQGAPRAAPHLVIFELSGQLARDLRAFAEYRRARTQVPAIMIGGGLSVDDAVELLQCGVADYLSAPPDPGVLRRKVERILLGTRTPAIGIDGLDVVAALERDPTWEGGVRNRRRCFRASIPQDLPAAVQLKVQGESIRLCVEDLSLSNDGQPGGMRLDVDGPLALRIPMRHLLADTQIDGELHLYEESSSIPVRLAVVGSSLSSTRVRTTFSLRVQYQVTVPRLEGVVRRFWMNAQRSRFAGRETQGTGQ